MAPLQILLFHSNTKLVWFLACVDFPVKRKKKKKTPPVRWNGDSELHRAKRCHVLQCALATGHHPVRGISLFCDHVLYPRKASKYPAAQKRQRGTACGSPLSVFSWLAVVSSEKPVDCRSSSPTPSATAASCVPCCSGCCGHLCHGNSY